MYKIIFSDIDGTLLNADRELSNFTIETIQKLPKDFPFILISSRMPAAMRHLQERIGIAHFPIISYNGGLIKVDGTTVDSTEIPLNILADLIQFNATRQIHLSLYHDDEWYAPNDDFWTQREINNTKVHPELKSNMDVFELWTKESKGLHKIMAMGDEEGVERIYQFLLKKFPDDLHLYRSKPTYLEIAPKQISKLTAVEFLLKNHFELSLEETIAFGDNYNDVEMLQGVGMGVAVGNARTEVMDVAKKIAAKGIDDGVAKTMVEFLKL